MGVCLEGFSRSSGLHFEIASNPLNSFLDLNQAICNQIIDLIIIIIPQKFTLKAFEFLISC
jgi:hypothetical protein